MRVQDCLWVPLLGSDVKLAWGLPPYHWPRIEINSLLSLQAGYQGLNELLEVPCDHCIRFLWRQFATLACGCVRATQTWVW
jgi:hypothetical protein